MKKRSRPLDQYFYHDIEDDEKVQAYLKDAIPLIGKIIMSFNGLETALNLILCNHINERSDSPGFIVLHKMNYGSKVDLFKRFTDDLQIMFDKEIKTYKDLVPELKKAGHLRNLVVHADWESTEDDGYTYVSLRITERGMEQEYIQLSKESLEEIIGAIETTRTHLDNFWEERDEVLSSKDNI